MWGNLPQTARFPFFIITKPIIKTRRDLKKNQASEGRELDWVWGKASSKLAEKPELTDFSIGSNPQPPDTPKIVSHGKRSRNTSRRRGQRRKEEGPRQMGGTKAPSSLCPTV